MPDHIYGNTYSTQSDSKGTVLDGERYNILYDINIYSTQSSSKGHLLDGER